MRMFEEMKSRSFAGLRMTVRGLVALGSCLLPCLLALACCLLAAPSAQAQTPTISFFQTTSIYPYPAITTLNWGGTQVLVAATTQTFVVQNTGTATASTVVVAVATGNTSSFAASTSPVTNCGGSLAVNATCTVTVTFTPQAAGALTSTIAVSGSNFTTASLTIAGIGISLVPPTVTGNYFGFSSGTAPTGNAYILGYGGVAVAITSNATATGGAVLATGGYLENLWVNVGTAAGTGKVDVVTILDGGVPTLITCNISGASATQCHDTTHSFLAAAGDVITVQYAGQSGTAAAAISFGFEKH